MRKYNLNIAGYNIGFESSENGPDLIPSERFLRNMIPGNESDIIIRIHTGVYSLPSKAKKVFQAPYVEEINDIQINHGIDFWTVWEHLSDLYITTIFPQKSTEKKGVLKFSLTTQEWDLWVDSTDEGIDPLEYPLDGLILYYLTVIYGDIMIHASGVNNAGHGYLFSGVSGKGKTTMAKLWEDSGAKVIHDDRLILRAAGDSYKMFNTPVYANDQPRESHVNKVFLIEHGLKNNMHPVRGAEAVSLVMSNCIQHNWSSDIIARLLESVSIMCNTIPIVRLSFQPNRNIIDQILENE
jgi:hypothetical protein